MRIAKGEGDDSGDGGCRRCGVSRRTDSKLIEGVHSIHKSNNNNNKRIACFLVSFFSFCFFSSCCVASQFRVTREQQDQRNDAVTRASPDSLPRKATPLHRVRQVWSVAGNSAHPLCGFLQLRALPFLFFIGGSAGPRLVFFCYSSLPLQASTLVPAKKESVCQREQREPGRRAATFYLVFTFTHT